MQSPTQYHKIQTVFKRDPETKHKTLIEGDFSIPEFEYLQHNIWEFTEKVDGTNVRVMWDGIKVRFGGKTDNAQLSMKLVDRLFELFTLDDMDQKFPEATTDEPVILYGEGVGGSVKKGAGNYVHCPPSCICNATGFILFDVIIGSWQLRRGSVTEIAEGFGIQQVPIIGTGTLFDMVSRVRSGFKSEWGDFEAEGIVARPLGTELFTRSGHRIITKIKCRDFAR
jgi:hypothetical protein